MAHRNILTSKQRHSLFALPTDENTFLKYYVFSQKDITHINERRGTHNKLGFALQLCAFRYPGRMIYPNEFVPQEMIAFVAEQLDINKTDILEYAKRSQTNYEHTSLLKKLYKFYPYSSANKSLIVWLQKSAEHIHSNLELVELFTKKCREDKVLLPGISIIERLCADALVVAERNITHRITSRITETVKQHLQTILEETIDGRLSFYAWLKRFEVGNNSADVNKLMERLKYIQKLNVSDNILEGVPEHRIIWLRQQGEAYYADSLSAINEDRRFAILAVCIIEWKKALKDTILDTHDRIVGKLYNESKRMSDEKVLNQKTLTKDTLKSFIELGKKLLAGHDNGNTVSDIISSKDELDSLISTADSLTKNISTEPLEYVLVGHGRMRRYTPHMLKIIAFEGNCAAQPLLDAIDLLNSLNHQPNNKINNHLPIKFAASKWKKLIGQNPDRKLWEMAVLFTIRDALRSRDIWVKGSRKYQDTRSQLLAIEEAKKSQSLPIPICSDTWINERQNMLDTAMKNVACMLRDGELPNSTIANGIIKVERLKNDIPGGVDKLTLDIYNKLPQTSITTILREVDNDINFTDAFTHLHTGSSCSDKIGLLNVLLSDGINLGLKKMALCSSSHKSFWPLIRISEWYVNSRATKEALGMIIEAQHQLPLAPIWGNGNTASADGQFFTAGGAGEAMNLINARYGNIPGVKAYTHVSDRYAPFAIQTIPVNVHEAPYIIDGLTMNNTGRGIKEYYTDTGGFADYIFAISSLLGYEFAPRLRNLPSLKLYGVEGVSVPKLLSTVIQSKVNLYRIKQQWPDIIRLVASIREHRVIPSEILKQLASFPKQNELSATLKEIGKIERTIFILRWISSVDLQRRAQMGLNKGEAHHALKRALNFNRRGEIRNRFSENQHLKMMNLNLLAAIIIYWNTRHLGIILHDMKGRGEILDPKLLAHLSPLGWEHIIMTGFYEW